MPLESDPLVAVGKRWVFRSREAMVQRVGKCSLAILLALIGIITPCHAQEDPEKPVTTSWMTDFPDTIIPAGMILYRANDSVTWDVSPHLLHLTNSAASNVTGMVRRPGAFALVPGSWENVTLTIEARSLASEETMNRDICLIFGYVDETHFYYAHLSRNSDGTAHTVIMCVNGQLRHTIHKPIPTGITAGPLTSSASHPNWHTLRLIHKVSGEIAAYVDDMIHPVMTANDKTYSSGRVGCGTFDDPALFRSIRVDGIRQSGSAKHTGP